jgi:hypothetical protein
MAFKYAGANSSLTLADLTVGVYGYAANPAFDELETSNFGNAANGENWETSIPGMGRIGDITVNVRYDSANTIAMGDTGDLTLTLETGKTFECDVWVKSIPFTADVAGLLEQTIVLKGTGAPTVPA